MITRRSFLKFLAVAIPAVIVPAPLSLIGSEHEVPFIKETEITTFTLDDLRTARRWARAVHKEASATSYFHKFIGTGPKNMIVIK